MRGHLVRPSLGRIGVWAHSTRLSAELASEVESLGYGAIWIGGSPGGDLRIVDDLLAATETLVLATGIVNIWTADAPTVARSHHRITAAFPGRFLLGVGVGHPEAVGDYQHPYRSLVEYLDVLDDGGGPAGRACARCSWAEGAYAGQRSQRGRAPVPDHTRAHPSSPRTARQGRPARAGAEDCGRG